MVGWNAVGGELEDECVDEIGCELDDCDEEAVCKCNGSLSVSQDTALARDAGGVPVAIRK